MAGKGGTKCTVCTHEHRAQIDVGLVHRVPMQVLANRFGLHKDAIQRHSHNHLSPVQRASIAAQRKPTEIDLDRLRESESEGLLASLVAQRARLQTHAELAVSFGDIKGAIAAENSIQGNLTLVAKLLGQLAVQHQVTHTNILVSADYIRLRQAIVQALRPFPDAALAVGRALAALEAEAAKDITAAANKLPKPAPVIEHAPTETPRIIPPLPY